MVVLSGVISYPIPAYQNLPIHTEDYKPRQFFISDIALGITTTVTTTLNMDYVIGQLVKLIIPAQFGSYQLNNQTGFVISIPSTNQVEIAIDSTVNVNSYIAYSYPSLPPQAQTFPQILAIGDIANGVTNSTGRMNTGTFIPGSFINIS